MKVATTAALIATLCAGTALAAGDGTGEAGFVAPPVDKVLPPAPPRTASSAESFIPGGCSTPMARTEAKLPPKPPILVTKLKVGSFPRAVGRDVKRGHSGLAKHLDGFVDCMTFGTPGGIAHHSRAGHSVRQAVTLDAAGLDQEDVDGLRLRGLLLSHATAR